ncbi:dUTP diphosphatase [Thermocrinis sp.]
MLKVKILRFPHFKGLPLPSYATPGSVGMDLLYAGYEEVVLKPFERKLLPTGIAIELPEGYEAQVRPRSGLAIKHGITILNAPGTIDSDYRGEIKVILINLGSEDFVIRRGDRIAQLVFAPVVRVQWEEVQELTPSLRGDNGFGSTGR